MKRPLLIIIALLLVVATAFGVYQIVHVNEAHKTFENYYAFRGCTKLIDKTDTYADCETNTGEVIKIVKYENEWYLDGDLPCPGNPLSPAHIMCVI